jgi:hypothetical protein
VHDPGSVIIPSGVRKTAVPQALHSEGGIGSTPDNGRRSDTCPRQSRMTERSTLACSSLNQSTRPADGACAAARPLYSNAEPPATNSRLVDSDIGRPPKRLTTQQMRPYRAPQQVAGKKCGPACRGLTPWARPLPSPRRAQARIRQETQVQNARHGALDGGQTRLGSRGRESWGVWPVLNRGRGPQENRLRAWN